MPNLNNTPEKYRYGFNGKENDNEVKKDQYGNNLPGGEQDYGMRIYDPRVGRFLSVDPLSAKYPELTPYQFAGNMPIQAVDLDGLEPAKNPKSPGNSEKMGMVVTTGIDLGASNHNINENGGNVVDYNLLGTAVGDKTGRFITDTEPQSADKFNMFVQKGQVFKVDESNAGQFNNYEAFVVNRLLDGFVSGQGYENYEFPENGIISSKFLKSDILKAALNDFNKSPSSNTVKNKQYSFGAQALIKDRLRNGTIYNITGMTGSGTITIVPTITGVRIKIFNITSLTSGTLGKELFGEKNYPNSYVREDNKQTPFGNISQTFNLFIPNEDFKKYL